jgi:hypothetical protein
MESLYKAYKGKAQFFLIYTREIHPSRKTSKSSDKAAKSSGGRPSRRRRRRSGPAISQHTSLKERMLAADKCTKGLKLTIPILLDTMGNAYLKMYGGIPAGTSVIDIDGKIAYWNRGAPSGCKPKNAKAALKKLLADGGGAIQEKWDPVKVPPKPAKPTKTAAKAVKSSKK